jgi:type 1 glutamine amidotransferase
MGEDHPIMWLHQFDGGRSFYTGFGHTAESYKEPGFVELVKRAVHWAGKKL